MRISDWSSDVCSSGLCLFAFGLGAMRNRGPDRGIGPSNHVERVQFRKTSRNSDQDQPPSPSNALDCLVTRFAANGIKNHVSAVSTCQRSEEHTSELQSLMRIS